MLLQMREQSPTLGQEMVHGLAAGPFSLARFIQPITIVTITQDIRKQVPEQEYPASVVAVGRSYRLGKPSPLHGLRRRVLHAAVTSEFKIGTYPYGGSPLVAETSLVPAGVDVYHEETEKIGKYARIGRRHILPNGQNAREFTIA
jgi:hypothetical protein